MRKKDSQYYSKIALRYILEKAVKEDTARLDMVTYGNLNMMEDLFDLFGGDRNYINKHPDWSWGHWHRYRFQFVLNKLDTESRKPGAIFRKGYICYNGIINRPTRCFEVIPRRADTRYSMPEMKAMESAFDTFCKETSYEREI